MPVKVHEIGREKTKIVTIKDLVKAPDELVGLACSMLPFPDESKMNLYPGLRRYFTKSDANAAHYVDSLLQSIATLMQSVYSVKGFKLINSSFSMVTKVLDDMTPIQRSPHYDSANPNFFAVLHYLSPTPFGGTNFYRHKNTNIERITPANESEYQSILAKQFDEQKANSNLNHNERENWFEKIGAVAGEYNQLVIYQGALLHSGDIPANFKPSSDPRRGRLTANIFIEAV
jgi:hypothetical protein